MQFKTRTHAGKLLAEALVKTLNQKYPGQNAVVYALPRGGVPLGVEIASAAQLPLDLIIPRKIGHPSNPEYAIGAVSEGGDIICNDNELANVDTDWFERERNNEITEAKRRRQHYLDGRDSPSVKGKIAILTDDGIATGLTMRAAILDIKRREPEKIIVAIPVIPADTAKLLSTEVDDVVALLIEPEYQGSVGSYYQYFYQLCDEEVIRLLEKFDA